MWRVVGRLADVIDRGPAGAGAGEDLIELLCGDRYIICEIYRKFLVETVDDKIKQMLFFDLIVCLVGFHITSKQTLLLTRCDRLIFCRAACESRRTTAWSIELIQFFDQIVGKVDSNASPSLVGIEVHSPAEAVGTPFNEP